jgi:hypothetical protein
VKPALRKLYQLHQSSIEAASLHCESERSRTGKVPKGDRACLSEAAGEHNKGSVQTAQVLNEGTPFIFCPGDEVKLLCRMQVAAVR